MEAKLWAAMLLPLSIWALGCQQPGPHDEPVASEAPAHLSAAPPAQQPAQAQAEGAVVVAANIERHQPKPGERVRQPELDGYCSEAVDALAFYYHGGNPVTRVARKDGCRPLYITECETSGRCYPPRDQEPGMWCCAAPSDAEAEVQQARR